MKNIRPFILIAAVLTLFISACSQTPALGDDGATDLSLQTSSDYAAAGLAKYSSGVYVVGSTTRNLHGVHKGGGDAVIRKVNARGNVVWGRQFGTASRDYAAAVAIDASDNAYVLGQTSGNLARTLRGPSDFFLRKYTSSGSVAWTRQMGLETGDSPRSVMVSGNNVYVVGESADIGTFVYRFNLNGKTVWKKQSGSSTVAIDGSGHLYVADTISVVCDDPEYQSDCDDVRIQKYTAAGSRVWSKRLNYAQRDRANTITAYGGDIYLVINTFDVPDDDNYSQLVKLNASGVAQWIKFLGVSDTYEEYVSDRNDKISADSSGVVVASSATVNDDDPLDPAYDRAAYAVAKFATNGSLVWEFGSLNYSNDPHSGRLYGFISALAARGSGDVYIGGAAGGSSGSGYTAFLKRLNGSTGSAVWSR